MFYKEVKNASILINNSCDKACKSCYLTGLHLAQELNIDLWQQNWQKVIMSILQSNAEDLVFAGKEPFFDKHSFDLVLWAAKQRDILQPIKKKTRISVISNGSFFLRNASVEKRNNYIKKYVASSIDFTNISIDGDPSYNDRNRGSGSWQQTLPNLRKMLANPNKVWVITTIYDNNLQSIPRMVQLLRDEGVQKIAFGFYHQIQNNNTLTLKKETVQKFASKILPKLLLTKGVKPVKIILSLDTKQKMYVDTFLKNGWNISTRPTTQGNVQKSVIDSRTLGNTTIKVWHDPFYWDYSRRIRITSTFDMLGSEQLIYVNDIKKLSPVNLKDHNFDIIKAREAALKSKKFKEYLKNAIKRKLTIDPQLFLYHPELLR